MKKAVIICIYIFSFFTFIYREEYVDITISLVINLFVLLGLLGYYAVSRMTKIKYIPKSNIILWIFLVLLSIPLLIMIDQIVEMNPNKDALDSLNRFIAFLIYIGMYLLFVIGLLMENVIIYLVMKMRKSKT